MGAPSSAANANATRDRIMWRVEMLGGVWSGECVGWIGESRGEHVEWRMWSAREMENVECGDALNSSQASVPPTGR